MPEAPRHRQLHRVTSLGDHLETSLTTGQVLQATGTTSFGWGALTLPMLPTVPMARVYHSVNQSINDSVFTALAFDSESFDTDTMHNTVTNNGRLTCTTAGRYLLGANLVWAAGAGIRSVQLVVNGATVIAEHINSGANSTNLVETIYQMAAGDYFTAQVFQNSGGALNVSASGVKAPVLWAVRQGA